MYNIEFDEPTHTYHVDGVEYPCVSDILRFLRSEVYKDIPESVLQIAADRGTRVHKQTEQLDKTGTCEVDFDTKHHILEYKAFRKKYDPIWNMTERPLWNPELCYCGTIDRYGLIDRKNWLIDIKTVSSPNVMMIGAQLSGYAMMLEANGYLVERIGYLHLYKDKKFRLKELTRDDELFKACLKIHTATAKKRRK